MWVRALELSAHACIGDWTETATDALPRPEGTDESG
jgi:hypothetical protein